MKILIDNGHGENTPGKRSPDGKLREYLYAREIAESVERALRAKGYDVERIVHETIDVPLAERARRVNEICARYGATNVLLVSIHCNAAGNGEWMSARGWSAYTSKGKQNRMNWPLCYTRKPNRILPDKKSVGIIRTEIQIGKRTSTFW